MTVPLWVSLWLSLELQILAVVEGRQWCLMASELVGTISFSPSLLPWLPLKPHLMGKGAWGRGLGCSGASPAWGQSLVEWPSWETPVLMNFMLLCSWMLLEASQL